MTLQQVEDAICVEQILARAKLQPRETSIIEARFYEGRTLRDVALEQHVSYERIRQIEAKAMRKLRWAAGFKYSIRQAATWDGGPRWSIVKPPIVKPPQPKEMTFDHELARMDYVRENWDRLCNERAMELAHLPHKIGAIYGTADSSRA